MKKLSLKSLSKIFILLPLYVVLLSGGLFYIPEVKKIQLTPPTPVVKFDLKTMIERFPLIPESDLRYLQWKAEVNDVPVELVLGLIQTESSGNPEAVGGLGELGLFQILPSTLEGLWGVDEFKSIRESIDFFFEYWDWTSRYYHKDVYRGLFSYNHGHHYRIKSYNDEELFAYSKKIYGEGPSYMDKVLANYDEFKNAMRIRTYHEAKIITP